MTRAGRDGWTAGAEEVALGSALAERADVAGAEAPARPEPRLMRSAAGSRQVMEREGAGGGAAEPSAGSQAPGAGSEQRGRRSSGPAGLSEPRTGAGPEGGDPEGNVLREERAVLKS